MSPQKAGRFSYLAGSGQQPEAQAEQNPRQGGQDDSAELKMPERNSETESERGKAERSGGEAGKERTPSTRKSKTRIRKATPADLRTVPKGEGRMTQDRSQLNVRIPTALKRQASAKAVLEGREIGEVVEELLRRYLSS